MKNAVFTVLSNEPIADSVMRMTVRGDVSDITAPGQFVNIQMNGFYLRRPISVCDVEGSDLTLIYKIVGAGTRKLAEAATGDTFDLLTGLGNGYNLSESGPAPLLIGGGVGVPPLYYLAKKLLSEGKSVSAILGFNKKTDVFFKDEFESLGVKTFIATADGSLGTKGFVTDLLDRVTYSYFYTCGPEPMLKAVYKKTLTSGQFSFEERMGCGFGACMGCTCKTVTGYKRICKDGPVLKKEEILWED
ncbi:MAG: dihydroorotate dehydrogenase electron transfer subunit [Clostridia bacterium]|nr:dihydroorotate dehydrogenase electron transfer subunit [Clostridia bacterium]